MRTLKDALFYLVLGFAVSAFSYLLHSSFLEEFFKNNLLEVLIVILSINITIIGLTLTKIKDVAGKRVDLFKPVAIQLRKTIWRQLAVLGLSMLFLIVYCSPILLCTIQIGGLIINGILSAGLFYNIEVLRDTATAIFKLYDAESEKPQ